MRRVLLGTAIVLMTLNLAIMIPTSLPEGMFDNEYAPWLAFSKQTKAFSILLHMAYMFLIVYISRRYPQQAEA